MPIIAGRASAAYGAGFAAITAPPYLGPFGAYDALASTTVGSTAVSGITFAGIPTGYKHLQIRWVGFTNDAGTGNIRASIFFNGDTTATNYYNHFLSGDGSNASAGSENAAKFGGNAVRNSAIAGGVNIVDILDYASTTKKTTVRTLTGFNNNDANISNEGVRLVSGLWNNTDAVTSLQFVPELGSFKIYTTIALYGVK
jgi:hypothetical protein